MPMQDGSDKMIASIRTQSFGSPQDGAALGQMLNLVAYALGAPVAVAYRTADASLVSLDRMSENDDALAATRDALCSSLINNNEPLVIDDVARHVSAGATPREATAIAAFCGVPVRDDAGQPIGAICALDVQPRHWGENDLRLLTGLATAPLVRVTAPTLSVAPSAPKEAPAGTLPGLFFERRKRGYADGVDHVTSQVAMPAVGGQTDGRNAFLDHVHVDDVERVQAALRRATVEETDINLTFRARTDHGVVRWMRSQSAVRREGAEVVWTGACLDISDLVAARDAAEAARAAKDSVLVDVNQELRVTLQSILGFAQMLQTETGLDAVQQHAGAIQTSATALLAIVNQLLDVAHGDAAAVMVERHPTDLRRLAETCQRLVAPLAREKGIESALTVDSDVPTSIMADNAKLQQVLVNLLDNAIKFTSVGSVGLRVSRAAERFRFSVSDTGIGIADDTLDQLFNRFVRLETTERPTRGTVLGLAITKQLVEAMDGAIHVSSMVGRGTTFWFDIPAEPMATAETEESTTGARILLADDLDLNRKLIADMLMVEGYEVDCVADGAAAVRAAESQPYDLILMDMVMPGMDGIAATRMIRGLPAPACDVPIIALTAHAFKDQLDQCLAAGMDTTLTKPMSIDALTSAVQSWTQKRRKAA